MRRVPSLARAAVVMTASMVLLIAALPGAAASSSPMGTLAGPAPMDPWLSRQLGIAEGEETLVVLVHGVDLRAARSAVDRAGLTRLHDLERIGVTIATGSPLQIQRAARQPGVRYVEGDRPLTYFLGTSHEATRGALAVSALTDRDGVALNGAGVSIAVIDTGVDPTHPFFAEPDGSSAVVVNLKNVCSGPADIDLSPALAGDCFVDAGPTVDTDTASASGHGTHVSGIVAGRSTTLTDATTLRGAAPGARIVSLSVGATISIMGASLALEWVLDHHEAPCGAGVPASTCPPVKVTNNSYGPMGGDDFNPDSATVKLQRELVAEGVMTVWANGNDGGTGSANRSNPPGQDPTPGILSVASYFDEGTGTRDGKVSGSSSRGDKNRPETWPDISAPGEDITSSCRPYLVVCASGADPRSGPSTADVGTFNTISGTSMAAPHVAGIIAQLFQAKPQATPAEVETALKATAHKYAHGAAYRSADDHSSSYDKGTGLVDVIAAVKALLGNRVTNGSFEHSADGLGPDGWTGGVGTGYDTSGEHASDGAAAVSVAGLGSAGAGTWVSDPIAVTSGESYGVAAKVTGVVGAPAPGVIVEFLDGSGTVREIKHVRAEGVGELLGTATAPDGAVQARFVLAGFAPDDASPSGTVYFDEVWMG